MRMAVELERSLAIRDELAELAAPKDLDDLKRRLTHLRPGTSAQLPIPDYTRLFGPSGNPWGAARALADECGCSVEFRRPEYTVWFTKRWPQSS
jgi:hypothetical protein